VSALPLRTRKAHRLLWPRPPRDPAACCAIPRASRAWVGGHLLRPVDAKRMMPAGGAVSTKRSGPSRRRKCRAKLLRSSRPATIPRASRCRGIPARAAPRARRDRDSRGQRGHLLEDRHREGVVARGDGTAVVAPELMKCDIGPKRLSGSSRSGTSRSAPSGSVRPSARTAGAGRAAASSSRTGLTPRLRC
jgi:hypothetical protein